MSKESALAFMEKASTDTAIRSRVAALGPNDAAGLVQIAASAGYPLSVEELKGVLSSAESAGELSDAALQQVSGGLPPGPPNLSSRFGRINPGLTRGIIFVGGH